MQKRKLNWWWFFVIAGIVIPLCYVAFVKQGPPPFAFSYDAFATGLNPAMIYATPVIIMLAITLIFKLIPRLAIPIHAQKVVYIITGLLILVPFYFSFDNIFQTDNIPSGNTRRYIDATTFVQFGSTARRELFPLLYFLFLFKAFMCFFIVNFPKRFAEAKNSVK